MLLVDYNIRKFVNQFNETLREDVDDREKFNTLKKELNMHLKDYNASLKSLENLEIVKRGNVLSFEYKETTEQPMRVSLVWKINELKIDDLKEYVDDFCMTKLELKEEELPRVQLVEGDMQHNYALYWPDTHTIVTSILTVNQLEEELIKSILRHEAIHHYLIIKNMDASDTSLEFMKLAKEHEAYVSEEKNARRSFEFFLENNK